MSPIMNYDVYTKEMAKATMDKLFFTSIIDFDEIVDYGCADGTLIRFMINIFPEVSYIGYDNDPEMIRIAREKTFKDWQFVNRVLLSDNWKNIDKRRSPEKIRVLLLSSILHEIYQHGPEFVHDFWSSIDFSGFDYIVIRDMINPVSFMSDFCEILTPGDMDRIEQHPNWSQFEFTKHGEHTVDRTPLKYIHFLLKYRYEDNWEREVKENYFSYDRYELFDALDRYCGLLNSTKDNWLIYDNRFNVPAIVEGVKKDFNIDLNTSGITTHAKYIIKLGGKK